MRIDIYKIIQSNSKFSCIFCIWWWLLQKSSHTIKVLEFAIGKRLWRLASALETSNMFAIFGCSKVRLSFFLRVSSFENEQEERSSYLSCERYRYTVSLSTTESFRSRNSSESFPLCSPRCAGRVTIFAICQQKNVESTVERFASLLSPCLASRPVASWALRAVNSLDLYEPCNGAARKRHRERKKTEQKGRRESDRWITKVEVRTQGISAFVVRFHFWFYRLK